MHFRGEFDAMTKCEEGKKITSIEYILLPCSTMPAVECRKSWYDYILSKVDRLIPKELNVGQATLEARSGLGAYLENCPAMLHGEVALCLWLRREGLLSGDIGVSKRCCVTRQ
jgi:hypothetical protein